MGGEDGMRIFVLVEQWLQHLRATGRKELTIESYRHKCGRCLSALEDSGRPTDPRRIGAEDMSFLKASLDVSEASRRDYLKVLNHWILWCTGEDVLSRAEILWNRLEPVNRVFIDEDAFARLMAEADERDRVILLLGGAMGLRCSEILGAKWTDISPDGRLTVHGKGHGEEGKVAVMKIPPIVMSALREWKEVRDSNGMADLSGGCIVVSYQRAGMKRMARTSLSHHINRLGERAGVRVTPHSLRRLFATSLYKANVDIVDIKTLMRHANVHTTINCYIQPCGARLDGIMDTVIGEALNISHTVTDNGHYEERLVGRRANGYLCSL